MDIHITSYPRELKPLKLAARTFSRHFIWSVPDDIEGVFIALKRGECHFRADARLVPSGVWVADIEPGHVPEAVESRYEVYGFRGEERVYLGRGRLVVEETHVEGETIEAVENATLLPLYDEEGLIHHLKVVKLENGDYTLEVK